MLKLLIALFRTEYSNIRSFEDIFGYINQFIKKYIIIFIKQLLVLFFNEIGYDDESEWANKVSWLN